YHAQPSMPTTESLPCMCYSASPKVIVLPLKHSLTSTKTAASLTPAIVNATHASPCETQQHGRAPALPPRRCRANPRRRGAALARSSASMSFADALLLYPLDWRPPGSDDPTPDPSDGDRSKSRTLLPRYMRDLQFEAVQDLGSILGL